MKKDDENV
jgi:hypothetical protein